MCHHFDFDTEGPCKSLWEDIGLDCSNPARGTSNYCWNLACFLFFTFMDNPYSSFKTLIKLVLLNDSCTVQCPSECGYLCIFSTPWEMNFPNILNSAFLVYFQAWKFKTSACLGKPTCSKTNASPATFAIFCC